MNFAPAPAAYDRRNEAAFRALVKGGIDGGFRHGQDVEIGAGRLIVKDSVTGARYAIAVVSGTLTAVAL